MTRDLSISAEKGDKTPSWAELRTCVCLVCRSALTEDESCEEHPNGKVQLALPAHRDVMIEHVWNKASPRTPKQKIAKALCVVAVVGSFVGGLGGLLAIQLGSMGIGLVALPFLLARDRHRAGGRRLLARPDDVAPVGARPKEFLIGRQQITGTVQDTAQLRAPLRNQLSVAFSVSLSNPSATESTLVFRDARTLGFRIIAPDGTIIDIPPGKIFIDNEGDLIDLHHAREYITKIDPAQNQFGLDPFPFDQAHEAVISVGDQVVVLSALKLVVMQSTATGTYREAPDTLYIPEGIPRLRVL